MLIFSTKYDESYFESISVGESSSVIDDRVV